MNALEIFKVLGIKPTDDYKEVRKIYITKLKKYQSKLSKARGTDDEYKIEDELLKLNEAYNLLSESNIMEMRIRAESIKVDQESLPKALRGTIEYETVTRDEEPGTNIKSLLESVEVKWEDKEIDNITEYITLRDFLNGSAVMFEDNSTLNIPPGFMGVLSRVIDNKIQFIKITGKDSVTFSFDSNGNLVLKCPPEDSRVENDKLYLTLKEKLFEFDLSKFKYSKDLELWVGKNQGILAYKAKKAGDVLIKLSTLKSNKNAETVDKIREYFENKSKE